MSDYAGLAAVIIRGIRVDGYCVNCTTYPPSLGGSVAYLAWVKDGGEARSLGAETWEGQGPDRYRAAVALAEALGWELE